MTAWSQIAADALGVPFEDVNVIHGDTRSSPQGMDTYGSRSLVVGGVAVHLAAQKVVEKARKVAAHLLEAAEGDVEFAGGTFSVKGSPDAEDHDPGGRAGDVRRAQPARRHGADDQRRRGARPGELLLPARHPPVRGRGRHRDRPPDRSASTSRSTTSARSINPLIVEGQVHGGLAQGIAQALYEEAVYDADGNLVTGTMVDYLVPAAPDLPDFVTDRTETPATSNPLGVKGVGEAGTIASTPAVVGAVVDAVRHLGVHRRPDALHAGTGLAGDQRAGSDGGDRAAEGTIAYGGPQTATTAGGAE